MSELRTLAIQIPEPMYAALVKKARAAGMTPVVYARCLLDAAYSVRVGAETQDRELAAAVSRVFARPPSPGKGEAGGREDRDETPHPRASRATSPARGEVKKEGGAAPVVHLVAERPLAPDAEAAIGAMVTAAAAAMQTLLPTAAPSTLGSEPEGRGTPSRERDGDPGRLSPARGEVKDEAAPRPPPAASVPSAAMRRSAGARARSRASPGSTSPW